MEEEIKREEDIFVTENEIKKYIRSYRNLRAYRTKTNTEMEHIARKNLLRKKKKKLQQQKEIEAIKNDNHEFIALFKDPVDIKVAELLLEQYLKEFSIDSPAEKDVLKEMIWFEVSLSKIRKKANQMLKSKNYIPTADMKQIQDFTKNILDFKERLGILRDKSKDLDRGVFERFQEVKSKCENWAKENGVTRTIKCAHCGQMVLLRMRTSAYDSSKHPYFVKDRVYGNKKLWELYKLGRISKDELAQVLYCSVDYIEWLERRGIMEGLSLVQPLAMGAEV